MPWVNGLARSRAVGAYVAGEAHIAMWPRRGAPGLRTVLNIEGSHAVADAMLTADTLDRMALLASRGFMTACCDLGQSVTQGTFGSDIAGSRAESLRTFVQGDAAVIPSVTGAGGVGLIGGSGGCTDAIRFMLDHPTEAKAGYFICPLVDVEDLYNNWLNGGANGNTTAPPSGVTQSEINKAYNGGLAGSDDGGVAYRAAMPTHNPMRADLAPLGGKDIKIVYSDNDPYIPVSGVLAWRDRANAAGANCVAVSQGNMGHAGTGVDPEDVYAFFSAHL